MKNVLLAVPFCFSFVVSMFRTRAIDREGYVVKTYTTVPPTSASSSLDHHDRLHAVSTRLMLHGGGDCELQFLFCFTTSS
jgi:hypothetical protein